MSLKRIRRFGSTGLLVELDDMRDVLALNATLQAHALPGQREVVAAAQTVLLTMDSPSSLEHALKLLPRLDLAAHPGGTGRLLHIEVSYDGADLATIAQLTGLSIEAVVNAHTAQEWTAAFCGFAPGFAYLLGENQLLNVPRRSTPRTVVPTGSLALAGEYSAIYPGESPGGWQLLGHTDCAMWDLRRDDPALIHPQDKIRFTAVRQRTQLTLRAAKLSAQVDSVRPSVELLDAGPQSLFQDLGRPGQANLGVTRSGAADTAASAQANRLVGNHAPATLIENLTGRLEMRALQDLVLAVTGATSRLSIYADSSPQNLPQREAQMNAAFVLRAGERLRLWPSGDGLRSYLAVRGGFITAKVLGSGSTDTLSGLGPPALVSGQKLAVGSQFRLPAVGNSEPSTLPRPDSSGAYTLRVIPGPRDDWFGAAGLERLFAERWTVSVESNRVGMRLQSTSGEPLPRILTGELASEGMIPGALQVPPSGQPVLFLADHPVTGGYPVIATVVKTDLSVAAQLPPGSSVRFQRADEAVRSTIGQ